MIDSIRLLVFLEYRIKVLFVIASFVMAVCFLSSNLWAETYYVATNGNDSYTTIQAQNINTPWKTIQKAASLMTAGDTCLIRGGIYRETVTVANSGFTGSPILFEGYGNEAVMIDGTDTLSGWTTGAGIFGMLQ